MLFSHLFTCLTRCFSPGSFFFHFQVCMRRWSCRLFSSFTLPVSARPVPVSDIAVSPSETRLFDSLLESRKRANLDHVQMRVVGGWCRDKLLSLPAGDIDICLSSMSGVEFATRLESSFKTVAVNPEKSKHLETAMVQVGDYTVDLSHMRTEAYAEDSRIPVTQFGSPDEDALRRDCTINALYYNLDTRQVEDPTGLGRLHLNASLVATPGPDPVLTLREDPLRLLRLIRIACGLGFTLDPSVVEAFAHPDVLAGLESKVSRQRILIEVDKMMALSPEGYRAALNVLGRVPGLLDIVLWSGHSWTPPRAPSLAAESCARSNASLAAIRLVALMMPLSSKALRPHLSRLVWPSARLAAVGALLDGLSRLDSISLPACPRVLGLWARALGPDLWRPALLLSADLPGSCSQRIESLQQSLNVLEPRIFLAPLVRGDEIARLLNVSGPGIYAALQRLLGWQMDAPELTRERALEFLNVKS